MNLLSWNCCELGNQTAVDVLSNLVREKAPSVLFLMETKQSVEEMRKLQADLPYRGMLAVPSIHRRGGLALLWKEDVDLHVQTYSPHHIDAVIKGENLFGDLPDSMGGLKNRESVIRGSCSSTFMLGVHILGYVVGISTKS